MTVFYSVIKTLRPKIIFVQKPENKHFDSFKNQLFIPIYFTSPILFQV